MHRRKYLSLLGAVGASTIAGCSGGGDTGNENVGGDNTPTSTPNPDSNTGVVAAQTVGGENVPVKFEASDGHVITLRLERLSGHVATVALADTNDEHLFDFQVLKSADETIKEQTHTAEQTGTYTAYITAEKASIQVSVSRE